MSFPSNGNSSNEFPGYVGISEDFGLLPEPKPTVCSHHSGNLGYSLHWKSMQNSGTNPVFVLGERATYASEAAISIALWSCLFQVGKPGFRADCHLAIDILPRGHSHGTQFHNPSQRVPFLLAWPFGDGHLPMTQPLDPSQCACQNHMHAQLREGKEWRAVWGRRKALVAVTHPLS